VTKAKRPRKAKAKPKSKRQTKQTKLDRLVAQGRWIVGELDGQKLPYFAMPSAELQRALHEELEKKIKKDLKADGFELLHATRRNHPAHSAALLKRVDKLASNITVTDPKSGVWSRLYLSPKEAWKQLTERHSDWPEGMRAFQLIWAQAYNEFQELRRDELYWRGTSRYNAVFPQDGPSASEFARPKPIFFKDGSEIAMSVADGFVKLYARVAAA
jgi:hypothetical protein